jgi:hypothetical protein
MAPPDYVAADRLAGAAPDVEDGAARGQEGEEAVEPSPSVSVFPRSAAQARACRRYDPTIRSASSSMPRTYHAALGHNEDRYGWQVDMRREP